MECSGHSAVLNLKPILYHFDGLAACVVRCGHLCQSWRASARYSQALDYEIDHSFEFKRVEALPEGHH
eukprot:1294411-Pyramimonas_sp.AAC.1